MYDLYVWICEVIPARQLDRLAVRQSGIYSLRCPGYDAYECEFNSYILKQFNMDMILFFGGAGDFVFLFRRNVFPSGHGRVALSTGTVKEQQPEQSSTRMRYCIAKFCGIFSCKNIYLWLLKCCHWNWNFSFYSSSCRCCGCCHHPSVVEVGGGDAAFRVSGWSCPTHTLQCFDDCRTWLRC